MRSLEEMGFESPTQIQADTIPTALSGRDVIGQAQTGTGKTVAFGIPLVEKVTSGSQVQGLVLTPTRELCIQVAEEISKIGRLKHVRVVSVYGGQDISRQIRSLRNGPQIVVATPGRLIDHLNRGTVNLSGVTMAVLDEADEMLDMGFIEDIESILSQCPTERQTLLFSATMKPGVRALAQKFMRDLVQISVKSHEVTVPSIEQIYYEVHESQKLDLLTRLLDIQNPDLSIVFGRTKRRVDELISALQTRGYLADGLHGDMSQSQRDSVMRKFREGGIDVLVATDVAARGLDVTGVTHVFNFDMPQDVDSYVHRIGRTGRAGSTGEAVTFVSPREIDHLHLIERSTKRRLQKRQIPTLMEARIGAQRVAMEQLIKATEEDLVGFRATAEELLDQYDSMTLISAALKVLTKSEREIPIKLTEEKPLRVKKPRTWGSSGGRGGDNRRGGYRDGGYRGGYSNRSDGNRGEGRSAGGGYRGGSGGRSEGYRGEGRSAGAYRNENRQGGERSSDGHRRRDEQGFTPYR